MQPQITFGAVSLALATYFQFCPAPPEIIAAGIGAAGTIAGAAIGAAGGSRMMTRSVTMGKVNQHDLNQCIAAMPGVILTSTPQPNSGVAISNIPSPCMPLIPVLGAMYNPVPQGSNAYSFSGLSQNDLLVMQNLIDSAQSQQAPTPGAGAGASPSAGVGVGVGTGAGAQGTTAQMQSKGH